MQVSIQTNIEPSKEEQLVQTAVSALRQLEERYVWDFSQAISDIEWLFDAHYKPSVLEQPLTGEQLRTANGVCPRHHVELEIAEYGNPDADMVCPQCEVELQEVF